MPDPIPDFFLAPVEWLVGKLPLWLLILLCVGLMVTIIAGIVWAFMT